MRSTEASSICVPKIALCMGLHILVARQNCPVECNASVLECKLIHVRLDPVRGHSDQTQTILAGNPHVQKD